MSSLISALLFVNKVVVVSILTRYVTGRQEFITDIYGNWRFKKSVAESVCRRKKVKSYLRCQDEECVRYPMPGITILILKSVPFQIVIGESEVFSNLYRFKKCLFKTKVTLLRSFNLQDENKSQEEFGWSWEEEKKTP